MPARRSSASAPRTQAAGSAAQPGRTPVDLSGLVGPARAGTPPCERVFGALGNYLLGYDLDAADLAPAADRAATARRDRAAGRRRAAVLRGRAARPLRRGRARSTGPRTESAARRTRSPAAARRSTCWPSCSGSTSTGPGCPTSFVERLAKALDALRGHGLDRTPELDAAVVWMFRSFARVNELVPVVMSILSRRLRAGAVLMPLADAEMRGPAGPAGRGLPGPAPGRGRAGAGRAVPLLRRAGARGALASGRTSRPMRPSTRSPPTRPARTGRRAWTWSSDVPSRCGATCCGAGWQRSDPRFRRVAPGDLRPPLLPHPRAARPALRRPHGEPPAVRRGLRLGQPAHPPRDGLRADRRAARPVPGGGDPHRRRGPAARRRRRRRHLA